MKTEEYLAKMCDHYAVHTLDRDYFKKFDTLQEAWEASPWCSHLLDVLWLTSYENQEKLLSFALEAVLETPMANTAEGSLKVKDLLQDDRARVALETIEAHVSQGLHEGALTFAKTLARTAVEVGGETRASHRTMCARVAVYSLTRLALESVQTPTLSNSVVFEITSGSSDPNGSQKFMADLLRRHITNPFKGEKD